MDEATPIRRLTRRDAPRRSSAIVFGTVEDREAVGQFLADRMLVPGAATQDEFTSFVEAELNAMTPQDRIWVEIEMASQTRIGHSFDFDASPWRR